MKQKRMWKAYELVGGILLLASFSIQNFLYDRWDEEASSVRQAILERAVVDKSVLLNESLYFLVDGRDGSLSANEVAELRRGKLREAVRKGIFSVIVAMGSAGLSPAEMNQRVTALNEAAKLVRDVRSYLLFVGSLNDVNESFTQPALLLTALDQRRTAARWSFLLLYIAGSASLLRGVSLKD